MYEQLQQHIGHVLYVLVGLVFLAATILFVGCLAIELKRRPKFSVRTLLIAMTVVAVILAMGAISWR